MSKELTKKIEWDEFRGLMKALGEVFGENPSDSKVGLYYQALGTYSPEVLKRAVKYLIANHRYKFPRPVEIEDAVRDSWTPEVIPVERQLELKEESLTKEERDYRSLWLRYYLFNIRRKTRGFKVGFINYTKAMYNKKYLIKGSKEIKERGMTLKYCLDLIEKYHKKNLFIYMDDPKVREKIIKGV